MILIKLAKPLRLFFFLLLGIVSAPGHSGSVVPPAPPLLLDPARVHWSSLSYQANKMGITASANITLATQSTPTLLPTLLLANQADLRTPTRKETSIMRLSTSLIGRNLDLTLLFDPRTGAIFQSEKRDGGNGKKPEFKIQRYSSTEEVQSRRHPRPNEVALPPEQWSDITNDASPLGATLNNDYIFTRPSVLFYIVSAAALNKVGDAVEIPVFIENSLTSVELRVVAIEEYMVNYQLVSAQGAQQKSSTVPALRITVHAKPLPHTDPADALTIAGLESNLTFYVDQQHHLPLELRGDVKYLGTIRFILQSAHIR